MIEAKYKAIYLVYFNSFVRTGDRMIEGLIILTSSGGIGGWLIWQDIPYVWAALIGAAQLTKLLKPVLPFLKEKEELADAYRFYEDHYLEYEELWDAMERSSLSEDVSVAYYRLRRKEVEQVGRMKDLRVPGFFLIRRQTERIWNQFLQLNFMQ